MEQAPYDLIIVGGGASGALAALGARDGGLAGRLAIMEKESQLFRKVLASGNGRCNLANLGPVTGRYHSDDPAFIGPVFERYPAPVILEIFRKIGLLTIEEREQRIYPRSFQARSVTLLLLNALANRRVSLIHPVRVQAVTRGKSHFQVKVEEGRVYQSRAVIMAAGSCAAPELGGSTAGYELLQALGHRLNQPVPALVPLDLMPHPLIKYAEGVRFRGSVAFRDGAGTLTRSRGEYLVTKYGLSGIAAMELGRAVGRARSGVLAGRVEIDFLPELDEASIAGLLAGARVADDDWRIAMAGLVPDKIARALVTCAMSDETVLSDRAGTIRALAAKLKHLEIGVTGTRGFQFAQVASGGIATGAFDPATLMSRQNEGLFACGEVLDVDGDTGGFNLLWAFASGYLAGRSAAAWLEEGRP